MFIMGMGSGSTQGHCVLLPQLGEEDELTLHNLCMVSSFLVRDDMHSE